MENQLFRIPNLEFIQDKNDLFLNIYQYIIHYTLTYFVISLSKYKTKVISGYLLT